MEFTLKKFDHPPATRLNLFAGPRALPAPPRLLLLCLLAGVIVLSLCAPQAWAQNPPSGSGKIVQITATGSSRYSAGQIAQAAGLAQGQSITRQDIQAAADGLGQSGFFSAVQYRFSSSPEGVKIEFQVADAPLVSVLFDNFPWFSDDELAAAVRRSVPLFQGAAPQQGAVLDSIAQALDVFVAAHHLHGSVQHIFIRQPDGNDMIQRFQLAGQTLKVGALQFTDKLPETDLALQDQLNEVVGKAYSRYQIELFNFEHVRPVYLAHAHVAVRFGLPQARFSGDPNHPLGDFVVAIDPIEPGPAYTWAGAAWNGNQALSSSQLDAFVELKPGQPADGMKILAAWQRIQNAYGQRGYIDAKIAPQEALDAAHARVQYNVAISEGPRFHMGDLVITNLSVAAERRIRQAWKIPKGQIFDLSFYDDFVAKGARQALADLPVHFEQIGHLLRENSQTGTVDVLLDFSS